MTQAEFISNVQQELSVACALPFSVPVKEIERIIDMAAKWFYKHYEDSVEERYLLIPRTNFETDQFKRERTITVPDCVMSIFSFKKLKEDFGRSLTFDGTADFGIERIFLADSSTIGNGTESLMYYVLNMYWLDVVSSILNHTISYNYNRNTHKLFISGEKPDKDCVAHVYYKIPLQHLMTDELFYRYVVAKCKIQLSRILGTFDFTLPGNVKINYSDIKDEGNEEIQKIEEEIKGDESNDFFFTTGGS